ncbi:MAG: ATP-binding cassette domain-containing protein [Microvirga sp.]|nr:ATP-binding cassette domain-containing protein [Microvirga sp.]
MRETSRPALLEVEGLTKHIPVGGFLRRRLLKAVDGVSFAIAEGETLGLVGESGCGKSTLGRVIARLAEPTAGVVRIAGEDLTTVSGERLRAARRQVQFIFQDAMASLNPRMRVGASVGEPLSNFRIGANAAERRARILETMALCGLPESFADRYPHQLSGGQRQRVGIARALILRPRLVIADEPISALDVSIQAQILNLFSELRARLGLTMLFISHDLAAVRHISNRVAVMYLGRIIEIGAADAICATPRHPYSMALLSASPVPEPRLEKARRPLEIQGEIPSPIDPPTGCRFHTRCPFARSPRCAGEEPQLRMIAGRHVACHYAEEIPPLVSPS